MNAFDLERRLDAQNDLLPLTPLIMGRFYGDGNRLGQRAQDAPKPPYFTPERWIASSTPAVNPPGIPGSSLSTCPTLDGSPTLKEILADPQLGPRLLGEDRFQRHGGNFQVLIKLLDAAYPIPFHVHADDRFVTANPKVYPAERFGKDEAYHFLDVAKGNCPYTHVGVHPGVGAKEVIDALRTSTDHVIETSPGALQRYGEGFFVPAGMLHRPGTALTLEIQQPSDVYTMFQLDFGGEPLAPEALHPGFESLEEAAERVINWEQNARAGLLDTLRLTPRPWPSPTCGGQVDWVFPPEICAKFSGLRLTVDGTMKFAARDCCALYVWRGRGTINGIEVRGGGGPVGENDELFVGRRAAEGGLELTCTGDEPLVVFALYAAPLED
ncbi:MAG: hypothetical protein JJU36_16720 [Phycisphaeraceae bacterium]|nr:hypothetical protein [Phycisphaeraceae bacterium]